MKRSTYLLFCLILSTVVTLAQNRTVTGIVYSAEDSEPIIGASIVVDGTTTGTVTTLDGSFSLEAPANATKLIISYIGMKRLEVAISDHMRIFMETDAQTLDEVVVTAMGISREKKSLGYAIQEVNADELTQAGQLNITGALTGKVAGVQVNQFGGTVGASSRISIRGNSSLSNDQQPLIVVDGIPIANDTKRTGDNYYNGVDYGSGINDINPEDIESMTVLKGGSAALYGMRAGNGVILITTKSGKKASGVKVSYDGSITIDRAANYPKLQNLYGQGYNGDEYHYKLKGDGRSYQDYAYEESFHWADGRIGADGKEIQAVNDTHDESWGPRLDIGLKLPQFDSPVDANGIRQATDWVSQPNNLKDFLRTGYSMNHNVSIVAKSEKSSTRASLSVRKQNGTVPNTDQSRYGGQINTDMQISDQVSFDLSANYTRTESDNLVWQGYGGANPMNQFIWGARQVNMKSLKDNWDQRDEAGNYTMYNWIYNDHINPYFNVYENTNSYQRDRIFAKSSLYYQPFQFLKFEGRMGVDHYNARMFERHYIDYGDYPNGGFLQTAEKNTELNLDFLATFNKTFGDFNVAALFGANYRDQSWAKDVLGADALTVPGVYTISNRLGDAKTEMDHSHIRSNSIFANASVGWKSQLYLDVSMRNDWSSTINDPFFYPSFSLSWIPTESFHWLQNDYLTFLKLRGSWAEIGNATTAYQNRFYYHAEDDAFNGIAQMYRTYVYPNEALKPENIRTWEIGIDAGFFDDRLHIDAAYYYKTTKDMIMRVTTANSSGYSSRLLNAGEIENKGVELQLRGDIFRNRKGFNWTSTLNYSKDRSKVIELYPALEIETYQIGWTWGIATLAKTGQAWGTLNNTGFARTNDGAIMVNETGLPISAPSTDIGHITPKFLMGWRNDFSYKNLSFGLFLDLRIGGDIWSQTMSHAYTAGTAYETVKNGVRERAIVLGQDVMTNERFVMQNENGDWVPNTIETDAQTFYGSNDISETFVFDGSFLKLREAYITYNIPSQILKKTRYISQATVSLIGSNLWLMWVHKSNTLRLDPETGGVSSDSRGVGFEQASVPTSRSFGLKVGLTF